LRNLIKNKHENGYADTHDTYEQHVYRLSNRVAYLEHWRLADRSSKSAGGLWYWQGRQTFR